MFSGQEAKLGDCFRPMDKTPYQVYRGERRGSMFSASDVVRRVQYDLEPMNFDSFDARLRLQQFLRGKKAGLKKKNGINKKDCLRLALLLRPFDPTTHHIHRRPTHDSPLQRHDYHNPPTQHTPPRPPHHTDTQTTTPHTPNITRPIITTDHDPVPLYNSFNPTRHHTIS
jgi:hypothetical protein